MTDPGYPPQPWNLRGQAYLSVWRLPVASLPALPAGVRPLTVAGSGFVITAWVDYQPGGVLAYRELLSTVAVLDGLRIAASITHIWVDSPSSRDGGRALWHIPKGLAGFDMRHAQLFEASACTPTSGIAAARFRTLPALPARIPAGFSVIQQGPLRSPVRVSARPAMARASWAIQPAGPLGFLHGRSPLASAAARDFRMRFGTGC
ncbi:acetoacetate decarboxylase family protein [Haloechinothrix sp. LS1_15]|uniref:acetoacetate decarboxylase family protein n=1 Tax=Haloechinothrix sp. LS1_15 TaxID=2652248 RepID=UPI002946A31B|nr:acetoacetate decarboxylase family protein [Haloechinothrix sp. LS1_15]MDV6012415.1 acetoacetate decarboxylase [Haloechinothrix sp. LS1_15]